MKKIIILIIFAISSTHLVALDHLDSTFKRPHNNLSIDLFGTTTIGSVGFEGLFLKKNNSFFTAKIGFGLTQQFKICVWGPCDKPDVYYIIPHHITANFGIGKNKHFVEMGFGGTFIEGNITQHYQLYPILGYRFQPTKPKKLNFRVYGSLPMIKMKDKNILFIPIGLSLGYCF